MVGPKKQDFWPRINILKVLFLNVWLNYGSSKSAKIVHSKSIFEPLYFLKLCPIFDELTILVGILYFFPLEVC